MTVTETKARLNGGPHDGLEVTLPDHPLLIAVSTAGDAEAIEAEEAGSAVACARELYKHDIGNVLSFYNHVTLRDVVKAGVRR